MPSKPTQPDHQSLAQCDGETALPLPRAQSRPESLALHPVTFRCQGAGAMRVPHDEASILFTFPVHADKCVRIMADYDTARAFARSLVQTLGGWPAVKAGELKRGHRR